jgi:hypothetical protein
LRVLFMQNREYKVSVRHKSAPALLPSDHTLEKHVALIEASATDEVQAFYEKLVSCTHVLVNPARSHRCILLCS